MVEEKRRRWWIFRVRVSFAQIPCRKIENLE